MKSIDSAGEVFCGHFWKTINAKQLKKLEEARKHSI